MKIMSMQRSIVAIFLGLTLLVTTLSSFAAEEVESLPNYGMKLSLHTSASKTAIWNLWADVENWKRFDERLEYSYLIDDQAFAKGAKGYVKGKGAPKTQFVLTHVDEGLAFTEVLKLPLWQTVHLHRYFESSDSGQTVFTHEVRFKGGLKPIFYFFLASAFKKDLKKVMKKMKELVEND